MRKVVKSQTGPFVRFMLSKVFRSSHQSKFRPNQSNQNNRDLVSSQTIKCKFIDFFAILINGCRTRALEKIEAHQFHTYTVSVSVENIREDQIRT